MKNDPLNSDHYAKIKAFADSCLLERDGTPKLTEQDHLDYKRLLGKDYIDDADPELRPARKALGKESFLALRGALKSPELFARKFGIDPTDSRQVYAARMYLKSALAVSPRGYSDTENIRLRYTRKMTGDFFGEDIAPKHALLMMGDPAKAKTKHFEMHPVDIVLQNCHFDTPRTKITQTLNGKSVETIYTADREHMRKVLQSGIQKLYSNPHTAVVIDALAALMRQEKGTVIFTGHPHGVGKFGKKFGVSSNVMGGTGGMYVGHHTVYNPSLVHAYDGSPSREAMAAFIHETQHMLFERILGNDSSPVEPGSRAQKALDLALSLDRQHRKNVSYPRLSEGSQVFYSSLVGQLENESSYFGGVLFDESKAEHLHTMRVESIVRPLEAMAWGASPSDIAAVAPNLWDFFQRHAAPVLRAYSDQAIEQNMLSPGLSKYTTYGQLEGEILLADTTTLPTRTPSPQVLTPASRKARTAPADIPAGTLTSEDRPRPPASRRKMQMSKATRQRPTIHHWLRSVFSPLRRLRDLVERRIRLVGRESPNS